MEEPRSRYTFQADFHQSYHARCDFSFSNMSFLFLHVINLCLSRTNRPTDSRVDKERKWIKNKTQTHREIIERQRKKSFVFFLVFDSVSVSELNSFSIPFISSLIKAFYELRRSVCLYLSTYNCLISVHLQEDLPFPCNAFCNDVFRNPSSQSSGRIQIKKKRNRHFKGFRVSIRII